MRLNRTDEMLLRRAGESRLHRTTALLSWGFQCRGVEGKRMVASCQKLERAGYLRFIGKRDKQEGYGKYAVYRQTWEWELTETGRELLALLHTEGK